jgi:hypothetical protein
MHESSSELRRLVRHDLMLVATGVIAVAISVAVLVAARLGWIGSKHASTLVLSAAIVVAIACVARWATGPAVHRRDRFIVLVPMFLFAAPALYALHDLGGGATVAIFSGALGFTAAGALGLAWTSRRRT